MKFEHQFGGWLCGLVLTAALVVPCAAAQHRPPAPAPHSAPRPSPPAAPSARPPAGHDNQRNDRPPNAGAPQNAPHSNGNTNGGRAPATPPNVQERWRNMTPQDRRNLLQNEDRLRRLPPAQQQVLRDRAQVWNRMTPEQREHIRADVLPRWRQMPPDRKQAIRQRLRVLQNMPESARNQRLHDPNFTRGMSPEDQSTLRDLSHVHVGGATEPPGE
jgi:Protein of unknown function (DUF3106)